MQLWMQARLLLLELCATLSPCENQKKVVAVAVVVAAVVAVAAVSMPGAWKLEKPSFPLLPCDHFHVDGEGDRVDYLLCCCGGGDGFGLDCDLFPCFYFCFDFCIVADAPLAIGFYGVLYLAF